MTTHQPRRIRPHATPKPPKPKPEQPKPHGNTLAVRAATLAYDYAAIPEQHRELVQRAALDIRSRLKRTVEDVIAIGQQLIAVRPLMEGKFTEWFRTEFNMDERSARNFIYAADKYGDRPEIISGLDVTTVYLLAAPSTPPEARAEVEAMIAAGEIPTRLQVKRTIGGFKAPKPKQLPGPVADYSAVVANPPFGEKPTITAEYTVIPSDTDLIHLTMPRGLVRKLQVGALRNQQFREAFSGDELDRLNIILSKALKGGDEDDD